MEARILDLISSFSAPSCQGAEVRPEKQSVSSGGGESSSGADSTSKEKESSSLLERSSGADSTSTEKESSNNALSSGEDDSSSLAVLIFSKDRPFQLYSLLRSIEIYFVHSPEKIFVIYTSCVEWVELYDVVFDLFSNTVTPILETNFSENLETCVDVISKKSKTDYLMLCVDDLIFYDYVETRDITLQLNLRSDLYGIHLKLHPGICYSHAGSCASLPPPLIPIGSQEKVLGFRFRGATADWAYPFDLCACIYRSSDVHLIIGLMKKKLGEDSQRNPNVLEVSGNNIVLSECRQFSLGGCLTRPVCTVVTVNKVQSTFDVPIHISQGGDLSTLNSNLLPLLKNRQGQLENELDYALYKKMSYMSVHIKDLHLCSLGSPIDGASSLKSVKVSVVIPILDGGPYIGRCLDSLLMQNYHNLEVLCVLNGCTDDSETLCLSYVDAFAARGVRLTLVLLEEKNLVKALNVGVSKAEGDYVCRLDVDDMMVSQNRITDQAEFLNVNPQIHVLGCQSFLSGNPHQEDVGPPLTGQYSFVAAGISTHPIVTQWNMMFRCAVLHPTVMFRKKEIIECGSYGNHFNLDTTCSEDYMLWVRVLQQYPFSVTNLPHVSNCIHQHSKSKTVRECEQLLKERIHIQFALVEPLLNDHGGRASLPNKEETLSLFSNLCCPEMVQSANEVRSTCRLIQLLYDAFIASIPHIDLQDDVMSTLKESKSKIATGFLSKTALKFDVELFSEEMSMLDVTVAQLVKSQLTEM